MQNPRFLPRPPAPLTAAQRQCAEAVAGQEYQVSLPYYSKVKYFATQTAVQGGFTYLIPAGTIVRAFSYSKGQLKTSAGFTAADGIATESDTNLESASQTISGEMMYITGISCMPQPAGTHQVQAPPASPNFRLQDAHLLAGLSSLCSATLVMNGRQFYLLGTKLMLPGGGGLVGSSPNLLGQHGYSGDQVHLGAATNGVAARGNKFEFPEGVPWMPQGQFDSQLNLQFRVDRDILIPSGGDIDNLSPDVAPAAGVNGYNYPSEIVSEWLVNLHGFIQGPRSRIS